MKWFIFNICHWWSGELGRLWSEMLVTFWVAGSVKNGLFYCNHQKKNLGISLIYLLLMFPNFVQGGKAWLEGILGTFRPSCAAPSLSSSCIDSANDSTARCHLKYLPRKREIPLPHNSASPFCPCSSRKTKLSSYVMQRSLQELN